MPTYVCNVSQLKINKCNPFTVNGKKIICIKNTQGIYAAENKCPHLGLPLSAAKVEDHAIECIFHKARFLLPSGEVSRWASYPPVIIKAINAFKKEKALKVFPVFIENNEVFVDI